MIRMYSSSNQEPPEPSEALNQDFKDMEDQVFCTLIINLEYQNSDQGFFKVEELYLNNIGSNSSREPQHFD